MRVYAHLACNLILARAHIRWLSLLSDRPYISAGRFFFIEGCFVFFPLAWYPYY